MTRLDIRLRRSIYGIRSDFRREMPKWIDRAIAYLVDPKDTLVITGFWRSGTTWLQDIISDHFRAKSIFEPLEPDVQPISLLERGSPYRCGCKQYMRAHMPFVEETIPGNSELYALFFDAFRGKVSGKRVRINRSHPLDALRKRVVVKLVRGLLMFISGH